MTTHINPILAGNTDAPSPFRGMPIGNRQRAFEYHNDFLTATDYTATDWVVTTVEAGSGDATEVVSDTDIGGNLVITTDNADNDRTNLQAAGGGSGAVSESWELVVGKKLSFATKFTVDTVANTELFIGLNADDTDVVNNVNDGVGFNIPSNIANLLFLTKESPSGLGNPIITGIVDDQVFEVGFHWDGANKIEVFKRSTQIPDEWDHILTRTLLIPVGTNLAISFAMQNGTAALRVLKIDYITVMQER